MQTLNDRPLLTREGKEELVAEVACLEQIRLDVLAECQELLGEKNPPMQSQLLAMDREIAQLRRLLTQGVVVDDNAVVAIGSEVTIADDTGERTVVIGGPASANPRLGRVSYESALARAVLGHSQGDEVELPSHSGHWPVRIVSIK